MFWVLYIPSILDTFHKYSARSSHVRLYLALQEQFSSSLSILYFFAFALLSPESAVVLVSSLFSNSTGFLHLSFFNLLALSIRFCAVLLLAGYSVSHLSFTLFMKFFPFSFLACLFQLICVSVLQSIHDCSLYVLCRHCHDLLCFQHQFVPLYH